ncbi:MAG TPA: class I SAM-dependent methyltransferase [Chryseolinea sp.]
MPNAQYYKLNRSEMLAFIPPGITSLLDVGCGEGYFAALVKETFHCEAWGVEPVYEASLEAQKKLDKVINGYFDTSLKIERKFDVISFNDVLEHLVDPWSALHYCKELLNPGGVIVTSIPNILYFHDFMQMLLSRDWKYEEAGIFDKTHLRFFTKKSIERMFQECGYDMVTQQGIRPTDSKKFYLFNIATFGYWAESQFLQYGIQAKPR